MIKDICEKWGIENYTINDDGTVDVLGNVNLGNKGLTKLRRDFYCYNNQLTSLEGSPREVGGNFYCNHNQLITLEGGPQRVGRTFDCYNNKLGVEYKELYRSEEYSLLIKRINRHKKLDQLFS